MEVKMLTVLISLILCISSAYSSDEYRTGHFLHVGNTLLSDRHHVLQEFSIQTVFNRESFCASRCRLHTGCTAIEICSVPKDGFLCRICNSSNLEYTNNSTDVCKHLKLVSECGCPCDFRLATTSTITLNNESFTIPVVNIDGVQWTVIQRRCDGSEDFNRSFVEYENGFGYYDQAFWLGNKVIRELSINNYSVLRVEMEDFDGVRGLANYNSFRLGKAPKYRLKTSGFSGNATWGDMLLSHQNLAFKAYDSVDKNQCATNQSSGGWWYWHCLPANLNGQYGVNGEKGITWNNWMKYHLKNVQMLLRQP